MPTSDRDIRSARILLEDAQAVADVLPATGNGPQIKNDLTQARILLDPDSTDDEEAEALRSAKVTVHPSNAHKLSS